MEKRLEFVFQDETLEWIGKVLMSSMKLLVVAKVAS